MKLTAPFGEIAEFNIKRELLKKGVLIEAFVESDAVLDEELDEEGHIWLTVFWDIRMVTKLLNEEAITYSRNFRSLIYKFESIETDLIAINACLDNTFDQVGADFKEQLPSTPSLKCTDLNKTSAKIIELFVDRGMY
ncbi:MAG: hypothetical protein JWQ25_1215 [Daejeonella sp.]|nr:hypothetical protein [Daejeonella sp.]